MVVRQTLSASGDNIWCALHINICDQGREFNQIEQDAMK
jgi:hypothetical protein